MKVIYLAVLEKDPVGLGVYFPDIENAVTQGANLLEATENASDALGIALAHLIDNNRDLPNPTELNDIKKVHKDDIVTLISVDLSDYIKDITLDKKTLKIPHYLNILAQKEGINFSKALTEKLENLIYK